MTPDGRPAPGDPFKVPSSGCGHRNVDLASTRDTGYRRGGDDAYDELNLIRKEQTTAGRSWRGAIFFFLLLLAYILLNSRNNNKNINYSNTNYSITPSLNSSHLQEFNPNRCSIPHNLMIRNNKDLTKTSNRFHKPNSITNILELHKLHAAIDRARPTTPTAGPT